MSEQDRPSKAALFAAYQAIQRIVIARMRKNALAAPEHLPGEVVSDPTQGRLANIVDKA